MVNKAVNLCDFLFVKHIVSLAAIIYRNPIDTMNRLMCLDLHIVQHISQISITVNFKMIEESSTFNILLGQDSALKILL